MISDLAVQKKYLSKEDGSAKPAEKEPGGVTCNVYKTHLDETKLARQQERRAASGPFRSLTGE